MLKPIDPTLLFSRGDKSDPRLGELGGGDEVAIVGYPDDEGIRLNGGRVGAAAGPTEIRRHLYKTTPHARKRLRGFRDMGDVATSLPLGERHAIAQQTVARQLNDGRRVLSLGGGNDYAFPDGLAFLEKHPDGLVINIDAHLDVRDTSKGFHSGTPFYRLLEAKKFDFVELGIQGQCNARAHWDYVEAKGGRILTLEEILSSPQSLNAYVLEWGADLWLKSRPAFLALDMDAFAWPFAVGTSAAWPVGIDPAAFSVLLASWFKRLDVRVFGIYETSPVLGDGTARLAAQLAHGFLHDV